MNFKPFAVIALIASAGLLLAACGDTARLTVADGTGPMSAAC